MQGPVLAVDPGQKRIGIAVSDVSRTLARPLEVLRHQSRSADAAGIVALAAKHDARLILIGQSRDEDGKPTFSGRQAGRLAGAIKALTGIPVQLWDESFSTQRALAELRDIGVKKSARQGHQDARAAAVILQSFLDHGTESGSAR
jgi:putative Holliday junction resolvase